MRIAGIILIIVGVIGLAYGGITYTRSKETVRVGPFSATVKQKETFPISPVVGGVIAALVFFYICNIIFIFGAEFNHQIMGVLNIRVEEREEVDPLVVPASEKDRQLPHTH